jgi:glycosyltransferase involved in cell wall biosynthesis
MFTGTQKQVFSSLSVILPVINETTLLERTVEIIAADCGAAVGEYVIVVCAKTTPDSLKVCERLKAKYGPSLKILTQKLPFLGGAMRDAFAFVSGSHVIMMASDMETPPDKVKDFIALAKQHPDRIITGSRWIAGGGFQEYSGLKYLLNFVFQKLFSLLYWTSLTDMTYGYRLFPAALVKAIRWEELRHPFLFETIVKPLRLGIRAEEVPVKWRARSEGETQNTFWRNFEYFRIGLKTRFYRKEQILA